ncbi:hypothetical protein KC330_g9014 [Hortaea werneckii]|nr:hypothetical protein KC330_g9014 [Hortaea werneckii]
MLPISTIIGFGCVLFQAAASSGVSVVRLSVDGRIDSPLGLDNIQPTLSWQIQQLEECQERVCPGDRQTAYEVQAAATIEDVQANKCTWETGRVEGDEQRLRFGAPLTSRDTVAWRVRVWDAFDQPSEWSPPSTWTMGLLDQNDWGEARWIGYPDRQDHQPLPDFVRQFQVPESKKIKAATLYLSGVGLMHSTLNGEDITDEVLAPGYSNYQLSNEYRTYDVTNCMKAGANALAVSLGNGVAYVRRDNTNPAVGRNDTYAWWQSQLQFNGSLAAPARSGDTSVRMNNARNVAQFHLGGTINVDTAGSGEKLESRVITALNNQSGIVDFASPLDLDHEAGVSVTGSGDPIAATDPTAGAAVLPRFVGRLEITYIDASTSVIVTDRSWMTSLGPLVLNQWYSGSDYNASREQEDWNRPAAQLPSNTWVAAAFVPPPNLATKLVARAAEPVTVHENLQPISVTNPFPGIWVFNFGQNFAGWPLLSLPEMSAGVTIKVAPAESLHANGTVDNASLRGPDSRGTDIFYTYTTAGRMGGESFHPKFDYFGMQWVQVTGFPEGLEPSVDTITGLRLQGDVPNAGTFSSSDYRVNRIHKMSWYSMASNIFSVFTDCPGREKQSYPADYVQPMGALYRNFDFAAFMRTTMRTLVEGQSIADTYMFGNVALKTPVYDWGYTRKFGDEINWGGAIVLVPSILHDLYGDTSMMTEYYDSMVDFVDYIQREKVENNLVFGALGDWVEAEGGASTNGYITGTWGYYLIVKAMARMANITGHQDDAECYSALVSEIRNAFNAAFFDDESGRYRNNGSTGISNATQAMQALALDSGLVEDENRQSVQQALVDLMYAFAPANESGPHFSGGTIGMGPIVRALADADHDDVLWDALHQNQYPSYGYFLRSTSANPDGLTTIPERWSIEDSKNHMILAQIEEWFHTALAGITPLKLKTLSILGEDGLVFKPKLVGDMKSAKGTYMTAKGEAKSTWTRDAKGNFEWQIVVPANTQATVHVPLIGGGGTQASDRVSQIGRSKKYASYTVPAGEHWFRSRT